MEQQKFSKNIQTKTQIYPNPNESLTYNQKTQKSLQTLSRLNNNSNSKIVPQVVISYNFQGDNNTQVRTHNLLIGLEQETQTKANKSTFRKNALRRVNYISASNEKIKNPSEHKKHQLLKVKSNDILQMGKNLQDTTAKSFHHKQYQNRFPLNSYNQQSTQYNTFWKNTTAGEQSQKQPHQKYINSNIMKIASRKSLNKTNSGMNIHQNSIQKVSRQKINELNNQKYSSNQNLQTKQSEIFQPDDSRFEERQKTLRLHQRESEYNQKLQKILRRVKRQDTRESLKNAYQKQGSSQHKSRVTLLNRSIDQSRSVDKMRVREDVNNSIRNANNSQFSPFIHYPNSKKNIDEKKDNFTQFRINQHNQHSREINYQNDKHINDQDESSYTNNPMTNNQSKQSSKQLLNYHRSLIQRQNHERKQKKKYRQLIRNNPYTIVNNQRNSLAEQLEFHRIDSEHEQQIGSSKKPSYNKLQQEQNGDLNQVVFNNDPNLSLEQNLKAKESGYFDNGINTNTNDQNDQNAQIYQNNEIYQNHEIRSKNDSKDASILPEKHPQNLQYKNNSSTPNQQNQEQFTNNIELPKYVNNLTNNKDNQKQQTQNQNQSFDLNQDSNLSTLRRDRSPMLTKRKSPSDYKEFLRMMSEENQKKRQEEDLQKQKELSKFAKNQRFKSIIAQNQHIKRIMAPIGKEFLQDRHKRLSNERKSIQIEKNQNGSIIEGKSDVSSDRKQKRVYRNQLKKVSSQVQYHTSRNDNRSKSMIENFTRSLDKSDLGRNMGANDQFAQNKIIQSELQSQENQTHRAKNSKVQNRNQNQNRQKQQKNASSDFHNTSFGQNIVNQGKKALNSHNLKTDPYQNVKQSPNTKQNIYEDSKVIGKLTGMKIPAEVIQNSRLNKRINHAISNKLSSHNKTNNNHSLDKNSKNPTNKALNKNKNQKHFFKKQGSINRVGKNPNPTKNGKKDKNQIYQNDQRENHMNDPKKLTHKRFSKPTDKRVAKQKQRKFKDWKNSTLQQKDKKSLGHHNPKDKQIHQKDWKWAKKSKKNKENKENGSQEEDSHSQQYSESSNQSSEQQILSYEKKKEIKQQKIRHNQMQQSENQQHEEEQSESMKSNQFIRTKNIPDQDQHEIKESKKVEQLGQMQEVSLQLIEDKNSNAIYENTNDNYPQVNSATSPNANTKQISNNKDKQYHTPNLSQQQDQNQIKQNQQLNEQNVHNNLFKPQNEKTNKQIKEKNQKDNQNSPSEKTSIHKAANDQESEKMNQKMNTTLQNFMHKRQQKKKEIIQKVIQNQQMEKNGFMEITQSKFQLYNQQSERSVFLQTSQQFLKNQLFDKRAQIIKYLYQLPEQYQKEVDRFQPNETSQRLVDDKSFTNFSIERLLSIRSQKLRSVLEEIRVYDKLRSISLNYNRRSLEDNKNKSFLKKIFEPYKNNNGKFGVWVYCVGVWRLIEVREDQSLSSQEISHNQQNEQFLLNILQKAIEIALQKFYHGIKMDQIKSQQLLKMITGLRVSTLIKTQKNLPKIFKQIEYNIRKSHIIRAVSNSSDSKFTSESINCVRKIQNTPKGQKVIQIVSCSINQNDPRQRYFWIKEEKFLQFFNSFTIVSKRNSESYWTNTFLEVKNEDKAVFTIESTDKHTSGSITLYPLQINEKSQRPKCTIAFYKQIQPQVLKLIGKASQRLPETQNLIYGSKLYFQFNIKGTYFVFLQLQDGQYNVAIESTSSSMNLQFVEFVKKETMRNDQCQYVEIDKIFKKKPNIQAFQTSHQFKQLLNFMKKTAPEIYQAKIHD